MTEKNVFTCRKKKLSDLLTHEKCSMFPETRHFFFFWPSQNYGHLMLQEEEIL